jgi:hypothetical protein
MEWDNENESNSLALNPYQQKIHNYRLQAP